MPVDARIILQGMRPPVKINTPFENLDTVVRAQHNQAVTHKLEREERDAARAEREQMAVRQILEQTQGDWETALPQIRRVAPGAAMEVEKHLAAARKERASAFKADLENEAALTDFYVGRLRAIPDGRDDLYQSVRERMARDLPDEAAMLPETYDRATVEQFSQMGLSAKEALDLQQKGLDRILEGKWREGAGTVLSTATDQAEWDEMLTGFKELGMPASEIRQFGTFSPENVKRAGQLAMTPAERSTAENQRSLREDRLVDNERQAQTAAAAAEERAIDNKRADAQLGISQAQLGLSRQRVAQGAATAGQQKPLTATAESNIINRLSNQWTAATKTTRELDRAINLMDTGLAAARRGDLAAGSQAVLVTFQKILDPTSVVRETEYDRSAAGQSVYNRVAGAMERLTQGGAGIRLGELEKFATLAKEAAASQKGAIAPIRERIGKTADRYNIPRELVVEGEAGASAPAPTGTSPAPAPPTGGSERYQKYLQRRRGGQ